MFARELRKSSVVVTHPEVRIPCAAASPAKWLEQQVRYAYKDLSAVLKTIAFLALPGLISALAALGLVCLAVGLAVVAVGSCGVGAPPPTPEKPQVNGHALGSQRGTLD
jgi:hypothetical protein